jgi:hypothetical protein
MPILIHPGPKKVWAWTGWENTIETSPTRTTKVANIAGFDLLFTFIRVIQI